MSDEAPATEEAKPAKGKKKILIVAGAAILLLAAAGGGSWFFIAGSDEKPDEKHAKADANKPEGGNEEGSVERLIDVPPMIVNLRVPGAEPRFLKLRFMLLAKDPAQVEVIKNRMPEIIDALQPFLRELRPDDLAGSAAVFRVKEEMLARASDVLGPDTIEAVLIQDLVQQ